MSKNEHTEYNKFFCLNVKNGQFYYNQEIENKDNTFYYRCNRTNEEGTICRIYFEGYKLNKMGYILILKIVMN